MRNNSLFIIVFLSGSVIMVLELVGTRILAPYFGTTIDVLTSIISVVLAALSFGYWFGGIMVDKKPIYKNLVFILFLTSLVIVFLFSFTGEILNYLIKININNKIAVFIASIIFFGPVNILLGMISPYAIRLKMNQISNSGSISGTFYAIGTTGSIFGTIFTGFFLIPIMAVDKIVYLVGFTLFISALLLVKKKINNKIIVIFIALFVLLSVIFFRAKINHKSLIDIDSMYQHISVFDKKIKIEQQIINGRFLSVNKKCCQSGINLEEPNSLQLSYTKYFTLSRYFLPSAKKFLMIGGGGYSFPKYLLDNYPDATIDVVEIDPKMTEIAKEYFYLKDNPRLHIYTDDGRVFLNKNIKKYDAILIDVFNDYSIPFSITTKEALTKIKNSLIDNGVVITNIISAIEGSQSLFLKSEYLTYNSIFPKIHLYQVDHRKKNVKQNIILISFKTNNQKILNSLNKEYKDLLSRQISINNRPEGLILTDNYAPVENMYIR